MLLKPVLRRGAATFVFVVFGALVPAVWAAEDIPHSGFLSTYDNLQPDEEVGHAENYWNPEKLKAYKKFMIAPVEVHFHPEAKGDEKVPPDQLEKLTQDLHESLEAALEDGYPVVSEAGPGVLLIRAAITDLVPTKGSSTYFLRPVTGMGFGVGSATFEAEALDAVTKEQIAAIVDKKKPKNIPMVGRFQFKSYSKYGPAKAAFDFWAERLRKRLDEVHGATD